MDYTQAETFLFDLQWFGIKLGLEQVDELLNFAGKPQQDLRFIHLAGTNGKGSTAVMLAAALKAAGFSVGLYTSPHLISVRERFRINGKAISENDFTALIQRLKPGIETMKQVERCPTYFEVTTVMAMTWFADQNVDFVILETGMGGRFDATNVIDPVCSVITGVNLDHQSFLGDSLAAIAVEKAGIIKKHKPCFCGLLPQEAADVVRARAAECQAELTELEQWIDSLKAVYNRDGQLMQQVNFMDLQFDLGLNGQFQAVNAALAVLVLQYLADEFNFELKAALTGLRQVKWPGRLQLLPDGSILDGAHNPQGIEALKLFVQSQYPEEKFTVIFANFADKNADGCIRELLPLADSFCFVPIKAINRNVYSAEQLKEIVAKLDPSVPVRECGTLQEAFDTDRGTRKLITGSLYLAGEVLAYYYCDDDVLNI